MADAKTPESNQGDVQGSQSERRGMPKDASSLLLEDIPARSERSDEKFRASLAGSVSISLNERNERYRGAWEGSRFQVKKDKETPSDCTISVSEKNLMRICEGSLNPQIAMLSGKVTVSGNAQLGVYFFNLVAPRSSQAI